MIRSVPGGPFSQERQVSATVLEQMNAYYGLDDPLPVQYVNYLRNLLRFDLGPSFTYPTESVNEVIARAFPYSLTIGLLALLIALGMGIPFGIIAALRQNTASDYIPMSLAMGGICIPTFVMGPILAIVFGLWLGWANVAGWSGIGDAILPALTLGLYFGAYIARLTRGGMLEVFSQDFIRTARSKGVPERTVVLRHALKGGLLPVVTFLGPAFAGLISGSFVVEKVFQLPGLGSEFVKAAFNRDYSLIMGTVLFYAVLIILLNLIVDIVQVMLNPKMKYE